MFHPDTQVLLDHWSELAGAAAVRGGIPDRSAFTPESLGARLARVVLIENRGCGAVMRLAGGWLEAFCERPLAGAPFLDLWEPASGAMVDRAIAQAVREARPVVIAAAAGVGAARVEVALAPLRNADGQPDLLIGLAAPCATVTLAPGASRRFEARLAVAAGQPRRPVLAVLEGRRTA